MPRKSRIDAPGALHHIIARGIKRRRIFGLLAGIKTVRARSLLCYRASCEYRQYLLKKRTKGVFTGVLGRAGFYKWHLDQLSEMPGMREKGEKLLPA